jgi:hypothetical protein
MRDRSAVVCRLSGVADAFPLPRSDQALLYNWDLGLYTCGQQDLGGGPIDHCAAGGVGICEWLLCW